MSVLAQADIFNGEDTYEKHLDLFVTEAKNA